MSINIKSIFVIASLLIMSSCIRSPIGMLASTKPLDPNRYAELGPIEETDCLWYLFGLFPISFGNNLQGAIQDGIGQKGGDALVQVTAETYYQHFIVVSRYCSIIQGIAVKSFR